MCQLYDFQHLSFFFHRRPLDARNLINNSLFFIVPHPLTVTREHSSEELSNSEEVKVGPSQGLKEDLIRFESEYVIIVIFFLGDASNNWSSDGLENEPSAFQPKEHAQGGAVDESAIPSKYFGVSILQGL